MKHSSQPEYEVSGDLAAVERERDLYREAFLRLYGALARHYSARGKAEKKAIEKYARTVEGVDPEDRPGYLATMGEVMIEALAEEAPSTTVVEGEGRFTYSTRTRTENRALALVEHVRTTGKASLKSTEARTVLETVEGRKLDRKTVHRAMNVARGILRASSEVVGGIRRLVIPSPSPGGGEDRPQPFAVGGGGDRGGVPRARRWAVPWDGAE